jgi:hypothetical protein
MAGRPLAENGVNMVLEWCHFSACMVFVWGKKGMVFVYRKGRMVGPPLAERVCW